MTEKLVATITTLAEMPITKERAKILDSFVAYLQMKKKNQETIRLNFICTHNSRRSHLAQIWAQTMAHYFGVENVFCYSGGTEVTAVFPKIVETMSNQGFSIQKIDALIQPIYFIKIEENTPPIIGFSKTYWDSFNPKKEFAAIMTCNHADAGCPLVLGADAKFSIPYEDPKKYDQTSLMDTKYAERSMEIAREMYYIFQQIQ